MTPRFGVSYDVFGNGQTLIRGGWGIFRFADQYNDYTNQLSTSQQILNYQLPGNSTITLAQPGEAYASAAVGYRRILGDGITTPTYSNGCSPTNPCVNGGLYLCDPSR